MGPLPEKMACQTSLRKIGLSAVDALGSFDVKNRIRNATTHTTAAPTTSGLTDLLWRLVIDGSVSARSFRQSFFVESSQCINQECAFENCTESAHEVIRCRFSGDGEIRLLRAEAEERSKFAGIAAATIGVFLV